MAKYCYVELFINFKKSKVKVKLMSLGICLKSSSNKLRHVEIS